MPIPGPDAGRAAGPDSGPDAGRAAGPDSGPDAGRAAGPDAGRAAGPDARRDSGVTVAGLRRRLNRSLTGSDFAIGYAGVVAVLAVSLTMLPSRMADRFVLDSSTNLVNLQSHPPFVLFVSAFVEPSVLQLWVLVPLLMAYGALQRWLGRAGVVITAVLGHVGATLLVATAIAAGIAHGKIALSEARAADVGVSYGLIAALGLLSARVPRRWRVWYTVGLTAAFALMILLGRSFTDLGHFSAWIIGLGLSVLVHRAQRSVTY